MVVDFRERTNPLLEEPESQATTDDEAQAVGKLSASEVIELVNEILGYDVLEIALMEEGYAELAAEMLEISESTLGAQAETFPPEE